VLHPLAFINLIFAHVANVCGPSFIHVLANQNIPISIGSPFTHRISPTQFWPEAERTYHSLSIAKEVVSGSQTVGAAAQFVHRVLTVYDKVPVFILSAPELDHHIAARLAFPMGIDSSET
jgi:hypothetical protein